MNAPIPTSRRVPSCPAPLHSVGLVLAAWAATTAASQEAGAQLFSRGTPDNPAFAPPTEPATPSAGQQTWHLAIQGPGQGPWRAYDQTNNDAFHLEHFGNLPCGITAANLVFVTRATSSSLASNDAFWLDFLDPANTLGWPNGNYRPGRWSSRMGTGGGYLGLAPGAWTAAAHPLGILVNLDLANLPPRPFGETNLIPRLNQHGYLNVGAQDDTYFDYIQLLVTANGTPPNDSCANAIPITSGLVSGSTACATPDGTVTCGASTGTNSVWYQYVGSCPGVAEVHTCGSQYDTVLSVHTLPSGNCPAGLVEQACNDDSIGGPCTGTTDSHVSFAVTPGMTYYIRVSGFGGDSGAFNMTLIPPTGPVHDACSGAAVITAGSHAFDTRCATTDGIGNQECWERHITQIDNDLWYDYTANCTGTLTVSTCGSATFDTRLAIYSFSAGCLPVTPLGCADDTLGCASGGTRVSIPVTSGQRFRIRLGGYAGGAGTGTMTVACEAGCPPTSAPFRTRTFRLSGLASGDVLSWCINVTTNCGGNASLQSYCDLFVTPPAQNASEAVLSEIIVNSINAKFGLPVLPCPATGGGFPLSPVSAACVGPVISSNDYMIKVRVAGTFPPTDFTLSLGADSNMTCHPVPAPPAFCFVNPMVTEILTSGLDCNNNGEDDTIDILLGTSSDFNEDGVPDECAPTCPCDWNQDNILNSQDFFDLTNQLFAGDADYNGDGVTNSQDFFDFLNCFFKPPAGC